MFRNRENSENLPKFGGFRELREFQKTSGAYGSRATSPRTRKIDALKLLYPEIRPGDVQIATPRIRPPGARNPYTSDPFRGHVPKSRKFRDSDGISEIPRTSEKSWGANGSWATSSQNREIDILKLLAPEIGPGNVQIATPRNRPPGARNPHTSDPFSRRTFRNRGNSGNLAKFGHYGNPGNLRKIALGGLGIPNPVAPEVGPA